MSPAITNRETRLFAAELKFPLRAELAPRILAWARGRMRPDPNAGAAGDRYTVSSLYLDSPALDAFHQRGSYRRSKYRVRLYDGGEIAFLERKLRTSAMLTKRRSPVSLGELGAPGFGGRSDAHWFHQRRVLRQLEPQCQISYERHALVAHSMHGLIRLTLDQNLRATPAHDWDFVDHTAGVELASGEAILELKFLLAVPALFKELLAEFALSPGGHSKYRRAMTALGLATPAPALIAA